MLDKPLIIKLIALIYFLCPVGNVLQVLWVHNLPLYKLDPLLKWEFAYYWGLQIIYPFIAAALYSFKRWGFYCFIIFSVIIMLYNLAVYAFNPHYNIVLISLFNITIFAITLLVMIIFKETVLILYFKPTMRWWRTAQRYVVNMDVNIFSEEDPFKASTLNISKSGCYILTERDLPIKSTIDLHLRYFDFHVDCKGYIIRKGREQEATGYGVHFVKDTLYTIYKIHKLMTLLGASNIDTRDDLYRKKFNIPYPTILNQFKKFTRLFRRP